MKLEELLTRLNYKLVSGSIDIEISDVIYDSRKVIKDCVFVCLVGSAADGHKYAADAVKNGAAAVVVSKPADISGAAAYHYRHYRYKGKDHNSLNDTLDTRKGQYQNRSYRHPWNYYRR